MHVVALRRSSCVLLVIIALLVVAVGGVSWAVPSQGHLDEARERAKRLEQSVRDAESELQEVEAELAVLEEELAIVQAELEAALEAHREAEAAAMDASARARVAENELDLATEELSANSDLLGELARDTYKYGAPSASPAMTTFELLGSESDDLADRLHYLTRGVGVRSTVLERSTALRIKVEVLTELALEEERELKAREAEAERSRDHAAKLHARAADLVSQQSVKLDRSIELVASLEADQQQAEVRVSELEDQVAREREEAARRERERKERERKEREERERRERQAASSGGSSSGGSSSRGSGGVSVRSGSNSNLRTVGGITVAASLAPQLEALLNHARRDGIRFGGHGYRSPEVTARLRMANGCPDVHTSPASSCRVPTARPGSSMHEKGLAVDFTYRGQTICFPRSGSRCSGNAGFEWLKKHAGSYGFKNLPTEAWHWSTNGR